MYLQALSTANPERSLSQRDCWNIVQMPHVSERLDRRSTLILRMVLTKDSGIDRRQFAVTDFTHVFDRTADELNADFRREAPRLAIAALTPALEQARLLPQDLDALCICTCTGYLCPGITSYVAESLGLRDNTYLQDLVGLGCGAAIPTLRSAQGLLAARPSAKIACIAVEICSAAFYIDEDYGVLISACLFGDGAAATIWSDKPGPTGLRVSGFDTVHLPEDRDFLRFEMRDGKLRNLLDRSVPEKAAAAVGKLWGRRDEVPVSRVAVHPGGRDVIDAIAPVLDGQDLSPSARVLAAHGNMSSPSVLFVLEDILRHRASTESDVWLVAFGAGFSAHSCRLGSA